jgi:hypothetical protein
MHAEAIPLAQCGNQQQVQPSKSTVLTCGAYRPPSRAVGSSTRPAPTPGPSASLTADHDLSEPLASERFESSAASELGLREGDDGGPGPRAAGARAKEPEATTRARRKAGPRKHDKEAEGFPTSFRPCRPCRRPAFRRLPSPASRPRSPRSSGCSSRSRRRSGARSGSPSRGR